MFGVYQTLLFFILNLLNSWLYLPISLSILPSVLLSVSDILAQLASKIGVDAQTERGYNSYYERIS